MYAKQISRLKDDEKSDLLKAQNPDPSHFVAFLYHTLLPHGSHSKPMTFDELASKYPQALILALLLLLACLPSTADAGGLVLIRDVQTGRMRQVWAEPVRPAVVPSEPARRSHIFERIWAGYAGPVGRLGSQSRPAAPSTWTPPTVARQGWLVNPHF